MHDKQAHFPLGSAGNDRNAEAVADLSGKDRKYSTTIVIVFLAIPNWPIDALLLNMWFKIVKIINLG